MVSRYTADSNPPLFGTKVTLRWEGGRWHGGWNHFCAPSPSTGEGDFSDAILASLPAPF